MGDKKNKRMHITVPVDFFEKLDKIAKEKGMTKSVLLMLAFEEYQKKEGR